MRRLLFRVGLWAYNRWTAPYAVGILVSGDGLAVYLPEEVEVVYSA